MLLPKYAELTPAHRGDPCQEYPGTYYIYANGREVDHLSGEVGEDAARYQLLVCEDLYPTADRLSLAWEASDNDPRVGQTWFTGYYTIKEVWNP